MKTLLAVAAALVAIYLVLVAFHALKQRSLIYYPTTIPLDLARAQAAALGGEPWTGPDGQWWGWTREAAGAHPEASPKRALVFHGNAGMALNRGDYADLLAGFAESGPWSVYVFEYPGYGPRSGEPGEEAFARAADAAVDQLRVEDPAPLLILGESIGSGVAAGVAHRRPEAVDALVLITPFDSLVNLARHHMPYLPAGLLLRDRYDNIEALGGYRKPLAVMTAGQDRIVPVRFADPLLRQHAGPVLHATQSGADHNTLDFDPADPSWHSIDRFLNAELR
ncbi:alpha/beta hydrolase [Wenzhouxiangella sp. XN79A]|uniref:alpha/beta hydrolase n=1 Tax=Wenzhouxiangella sp. XN79A TaxID=2724193 RepID=UPI00144A6BCD|nr:alpha/beta fold hydrolase [Wenzhouxiangella sp. XN79A]NKI36088.1 alpha/beta hydrolase [Wenzhouxiangella sp. XN79A]